MPIIKKKKVSTSKAKAHARSTKAKAKIEKLEDYVSALDLKSMWEEFANEFNENGTQKYKTVWTYISKFTKSDKERDILYWMLGPKVVLEKGQTPKYSLDQYDWEDKRTNGFWFSSTNVENIKADIKHKASAYESVKQAGQVNVDTIALLNNLLRQLDAEFGGRLFLPNLTMKENAFRAQLYMQLVEKITTISKDAQLMYARSQGLDLERLDQFFAMFGSSMGRTAATLMGTNVEELPENAGGHHLKTQFGKVVDMVMNKALEYSMPLPDNLAEAIKQTESDAKPTKKKSVN